MHNKSSNLTRKSCVSGDPNIELGKHISVGSKASWETIPEGVPQYQKGAPKNA